MRQIRLMVLCLALLLSYSSAEERKGDRSFAELGANERVIVVHETESWGHTIKTRFVFQRLHGVESPVTVELWRDRKQLHRYSLKTEELVRLDKMANWYRSRKAREDHDDFDRRIEVIWIRDGKRIHHSKIRDDGEPRGRSYLTLEALRARIPEHKS